MSSRRHEDALGAATEVASAETARPRPHARLPAFTAWGVTVYGVALAGLLLLSLRVTAGRLVYVLDDPAIHLSIAENLADHGTWGVQAGHFQSASSAPLWTLLLAVWIKLTPGSGTLAPLVLGAAASVAIIAILGATQQVLRPSLRRPLDALAVAALVVVVLFLPSLAMVGMEHTLQAALVLGAVVAFHRRAGPPWLPYVLLVLAALTRFETAFVAVGLAVAMLVTSPHDRRRPLGVLAAGLVPIAAFAAVNLAMGQGLLPNSVVAKTALNADAGEPLYREIPRRLTEDPLVAVLLAVLLVGLLVAWRDRGRAPGLVFLAVVYIVATVLHVALARVGWYERYQAYLIVLGVYAVLCMIAEVLPASGTERDAAPSRGGQLPAAIVLVLLLFTWTKAELTVQVREAVGETYQQRYQAGLFFERYYDGEPIATGELGYVTLFHDGPVTDFFGLGDHEVVEARRRFGQQPPAEYWSDLAEQRRFQVVGVYPTTLFLDTPEHWIRVGTWEIDPGTITAWEPEFGFWVTRPEAVATLQANLREFEAELPPGVTLRLDELAELRAAQLQAGSSP